MKVAKEYIERDEILSHKWKVRVYDPNDPDPVNEVVSVSTILCIPAADVVEVVRCKDCIYWRGENDPCKGICIDFDADGYCSEGKRKDGGQDDV